MANIQERSNNALAKNPNVFTYPASSDINITTRGSDIYFTVCAMMSLATLIFIGLSFRVHRRNRIFHYITAAITMTAAVAYWTMGSNLGYAAIAVEFRRSSPKVSGVYREIFYVRYIDWVVTTPLLLMDLLLTAGMPWPTIFWIIFLDEVMIITGLVGALVGSSYKWGYYVIANLAFFLVVHNLVFVARKHANAISKEVGRAYLYCGALTVFLWFGYPIAWGVSEGGNVIAPDSEAIFYAILDVLAKIGFGAALLFFHRNIDPAILGLHIRDYEDGPTHVGEKHHGNHNHNGIGNNGVDNGTVPAFGAATGTTAGVPHSNGGQSHLRANGSEATEQRAQNIATNDNAVV